MNVLNHRVEIPGIVSDEVLGEFDHRCAKCGGTDPQLQHIDEDPSNHEPLNLIPLCANCHPVKDDSQKKVEPAKLRLFRIYKDLAIFKPQFHPLFIRLRFLEAKEGEFVIEELEQKALELSEFIFAMEKGGFYGTGIGRLIIPREIIARNQYVRRFTDDAQKTQAAAEYYQRLQSVKEQVYTLVMEVIHFQPW